MTTTTVKVVDASGAGDYTSWASWFSACPANLVTTDQIWQGQGVGNFTVTASLVLSGITTDSTRYLEMTTQATKSWRDNASVQTNAYKANSANGVTITSSTGYVIIINSTQDYTRFSNLQFVCTTTNGGSFLHAATGLHGQVENCIMESTSATGLFQLYGAGVWGANCLAIQRTASRAQISSVGGAATAYNCTFVVPSDKTAATKGNLGSYAAPTFQNCTWLNCTNLWGTGSTPTFTTCQTSVAGNPNSTTSVTFDTALVAATTDTARDLKPVTGSAMLDVGTTDSTHAGTDAAKTTRPQGSAYDIGAWELVSATNIIPLYGKMSGFGIQSYGLRI